MSANPKHFSPEIEQGVLCGILLDHTNKTWQHISAILTEEDFFIDEYKIIFNAMQDIADSKQLIEIGILEDFLKSDSKLINKLGGQNCLKKIIEEILKAPSTPNSAIYYAKILIEYKNCRQGNKAAIDFQKNVTRNTFQTELEKLENNISEIRKSQALENDSALVCDKIGQIYDKIIEAKKSGTKYRGLMTGFHELDEILCGLEPSNLMILAARPSMGKTVLGTNIALNMAKEGKHVIFFSIEMSMESLLYRMLSSVSNINHSKIKMGELNKNETEQLDKAKKSLETIPLRIVENGSLTINDIKAKLFTFDEPPVDCIVIDYIQLMEIHGNMENRVQELSKISRQLKAIAKEFNIPVICISQLNRNLESRNDKRPIMSDLKESGALEQDADFVVFIYRDEIYNRETAEKNIAEINVAKSRNGAIGQTKLKFIPQFVKFENRSKFLITKDNINTFDYDKHYGRIPKKWR